MGHYQLKNFRKGKLNNKMPFTDQSGNSFEHMTDIICPIGEHIREDKWRLSGTGFFISREGIALSAAHCFYQRGIQINNNNISNQIPKERYSICAPVFFRQIPEGEEFVRIEIVQIRNVIMLPKLDIAIVLAGVSNNKKRLNLTRRIPEIGETIYAYSFPNEEGNTDNISGKLALVTGEFEGKISQHFLNGRDKFNLPGPCIEAEMNAPGGTSGGPVFDKDGRVFGVISTSFDSIPPIAYITPISTIFNTKITLDTDLGKGDYSINELSKLGIVSIIN